MKQGRIEEKQDPFNGKFDEAKTALVRVLHSSFSGYLSEAMLLGNTATTAIRLLNGEYEINEVSFKVTTAAEPVA